MDYEKFSDDIIRLVGGVENIKQLNHCITRLRFNQKQAEVPHFNGDK